MSVLLATSTGDTTAELDSAHAGEGLRRTTDSVGAAALRICRALVSQFDEIQDQEACATVSWALVLSMITLPSRSRECPRRPQPRADALAAYVASLDNASLPKSPHRNSTAPSLPRHSLERLISFPSIAPAATSQELKPTASSACATTWAPWEISQEIA